LTAGVASRNFGPERNPDFSPIPGLERNRYWPVLIVLSGVFAMALTAIRLPAALLLGPMIAAILVALSGAGVRVPNRLFLIAQAVIGCMIARTIPASIVGEVLRNWPLFIAVVAAVIAASSAIGWQLTRWRVLPGSTAVWGSTPGAASAMMLMAAAYGADIRLVAFMQYLRVLFVAVVATVFAKLWTGGAPAATAATDWFPPIAWVPFAETVALIAFGAACSRLRRVPAAPLLVPLGVGMALQDAGLVAIELPPWLLALSYPLVGWSIGRGFNRPILVYSAGDAPCRYVDPLAARGLRWPCRNSRRVCGRRSAHRLSRNQSRWRRLGSDNCIGEQRRCGIRHGDADHAARARAADRPKPRELHREADRCLATIIVTAAQRRA
jgi:membrane AbrB-like protein